MRFLKKNRSGEGTLQGAKEAALLSDDVLRIKLIKNISLVLIFVAFPFGFIFHFMQLPLSLSVFAFFVVGILGGCLWLNRKGFERFPPYGLELSTLVSVFFYADTLGRQAGVQNFLFACLAIPLVIFDYRQKVERGVFFSLPVIIFFILESTNYSFFDPVLLSSNYARVINLTIVGMTSLTIILVIRFYFTSARQSKEALEEAYEEARERNILLEKLSQQAAFTTLTMGISHEIRNPLAGMLGRSEIVKKNLADVEQVEKFADTVQECVYRILNVTETMLKYGNPVAKERKDVDINQLIDEMLYLAESRCREKQLVLDKDFDSNLPLVFADSNRLHQAFLNIMLNAIQATPSAGKILVSTKQVSFKNSENKSVEGVCVSIKDTGDGISKDNQEKIYDPFFTTKYENTGLGLSIALKCIASHKGIIEVESDEGEGTSFRVYLSLDL